MGLWDKAVLVSLLSLATLLGGCSTRKAAEDFGGERLPGTETIHRPSADGFLISPDGRWLLFEASDVITIEPEFVLFDIAERSARAVRNPEAEKDPAYGGQGPRLRAIRWSDDGTSAWSVRDVVFRLDTTASPLEFVQLPSQEGIPPVSLQPGPESLGFRVVKISGKEARLETTDATPKVLATHRLWGINEGSIDIARLTLSPDRSHVAYVVVGLKGGTFSGQNRGFVLDLSSDESSEPRLLADPIYGPIVWHPSQRVLFAVAVGRDGNAAIYQWDY